MNTIPPSSTDQDSAFESNIASLRDKIDIIDQNIIEQISDRLILSYQVGQLKNRYHKPIYNFQREQKIVQKLITDKKRLFRHAYDRFKKEAPSGAPLPSCNDFLNAFPDETLRAIYHEILSSSRNTQKKIRVAYLGSPGSFSHIAALEIFGSSSLQIPYLSFDRIFNALDKQSEVLAIIPIENSSEGIVGATVDLMISHNVKVAMEHFLPVRLSLLSRATDLNEIQSISSHPQAINQAKGWIADHLPNASIREAQSTAHAAELSSRYINYACITSPQLALLYPKLHTLADNIQDHNHNTTRFFVLKKSQTSTSIITPFLQQTLPDQTQTSAWRTTIIFAPVFKDQPGTLLNVLKILKKFNINMSNLVSRPSKKKAFDYLFYADLIGHEQERTFINAFTAIKEIARPFKSLGSYPISNLS